MFKGLHFSSAITLAIFIAQTPSHNAKSSGVSVELRAAKICIGVDKGVLGGAIAPPNFLQIILLSPATNALKERS